MEASATAPKRAGLVLAALIAVAAVANLGLAVANVALPSIGEAFDASQTELNLVAVGYSLGLAASVLYLGAVGDRYGRKLLLVLGMILTVPADLLAAWAPSVEFLFGARVLGGLAAGMAYPTTLALIAALWSGPARTKSIALWAATGGAIAALGPLCSGILLEHFWWGSVFLLTLPLAAIGLVMAVVLVPAHVNETTEPVDHAGGVLSIFLVGALILGINFAAVPNKGALVIGLVLVAAAALIAFLLRQRRARNPLYDLQIASRPTFWVAAVAGIIVFGSLMGSMYIGQQFLQNVLAYSTRRRRARDPARGGVHGARRATLGDARRAQRRQADAPHGVPLRPAGLPHDAPAVEGGDPVLEGRARLLLHGHRCRPRRHAGVALAHRVGAGHAGRDGVRNRRPPARPRRRDHAVDLRGAADGRVRGRGGSGDHGVRARTSRTTSRAS